MCGAFHTRGNVTRLYLKRNDGGRGLISVEDCVRMEDANLARDIGESDEWMLKEVAEIGKKINNDPKNINNAACLISQI